MGKSRVFFSMVIFILWIINYLHVNPRWYYYLDSGEQAKWLDDSTRYQIILQCISQNIFNSLAKNCATHLVKKSATHDFSSLHAVNTIVLKPWHHSSVSRWTGTGYCHGIHWHWNTSFQFIQSDCVDGSFEFMCWFVLKPWLMNQLATSIQSIISVPTLSTQTNATPANQLVVLLVQSVPVVGLASRVINYCCKPVVQSSKVPMIRSSWGKLVKVLLTHTCTHGVHEFKKI